MLFQLNEINKSTFLFSFAFTIEGCPLCELVAQRADNSQLSSQYLIN